MAVAWIGFASAVIATLASVFVAVRQARMDERLARVNADLQTEVHRREALIDQGLRAEEVLTRYREPLAAAAFDLQSRLYNILCLDFLGKYGGDPVHSEEMVPTTVFRVAQYLGWTEILRRDIQFLSFPEDQDTRRVAQLQAEISKRLLSQRLGRALMIWSDDQRGIGEQMIVEQYGKVLCMGYATFRKRCDDVFAPWCERFRTELPQESARDRLREMQHLLCDLVETLDTRRVRYTQDLDRA